MSNENSGGSAFPDFRQDGMTLRDYFAAKAMAAMLTDPSWKGHTIGTAAETSYQMADAMLAERMKP
jgi:hypothetical protein